MDQQLVELIKDELVMLSLINEVEVDHNETGCHAYINDVPLFSLYFTRQSNYLLIPTNYSAVTDTSDAILVVIKNLIKKTLKEGL